MKERKTLTKAPKENKELQEPKEKESLPKEQTQSGNKTDKKLENQEQKEKNEKKGKQEKEEKRISLEKSDPNAKPEIKSPIWKSKSSKHKEKMSKQVLNGIPENHDENYNFPEFIKKDEIDSFTSSSESDDKEEVKGEKNKDVGIEDKEKIEQELKELEEQLRESEIISSPKKKGKSNCKVNN